MLRIPLGTYSLEVGYDIQKKFEELRNRCSERSLNRIHAYVLLRGRGSRRGGFTDVLPLKFAQRVAVYIIIDVEKMRLKENKIKIIWQNRWFERQKTNLREIEGSVK